MGRIRLRSPFLFIGGFAIFFPSFDRAIGNTGVILLNFSVIILCLVALVNLLKKKPSFFSEKRKYIYHLFAICLVFFIHIPLAISIGALFNGFDVIIRDFFELHRPVYILFVFCLGLIMVQIEDGEGESSTFNKFLVIVFLGLLVLGVNQTFRISDLVTSAYTKDLNVRTRRLSAPFMNPYDYAFIMMFFIFYFLSKIIYTRKWNVVPFVLAFILFLSTQSRSMAISLIFGLFIVFPFVVLIVNWRRLFKWKLTKSFRKFVLMVSLIIIAILMSIPLLLVRYEYLTKDFVAIVESGDVGSGVSRPATIRKEQFDVTYDLAVNNPLILLFGNGPAKKFMEHVESIYTYFIFRYGLLGFVLYFIIPLLIGITLTWKVILKMHPTHKDYPMFVAVLTWLICVPLCSIGNNLTEQVRVSFFYYSLLGVILGTYINIYQKNNIITRGAI